MAKTDTDEHRVWLLVNDSGCIRRYGGYVDALCVFPTRQKAREAKSTGENITDAYLVDRETFEKIEDAGF